MDGDPDWLEPDESDKKRLPPRIADAIVATAERLDDLDPHSLIGVEQGADWIEIERAYRQRLAMFHPNRWADYDLGDLRARMQIIVDRISLAYAQLAEERANEQAGDAVERATSPVDLRDIDVDLSGDRPTYPTSVVQAIPSAPARRAKPPRPPPRKIA